MAGDTLPGDPDPLADEEVPIASGDIVEIDIVLERSSGRPEGPGIGERDRRGHVADVRVDQWSRVATMSWVMPPER